MSNNFHDDVSLVVVDVGRETEVYALKNDGDPISLLSMQEDFLEDKGVEISVEEAIRVAFNTGPACGCHDVFLASAQVVSVVARGQGEMILHHNIAISIECTSQNTERT